jgi:hypothetical protein
MENRAVNLEELYPDLKTGLRFLNKNPFRHEKRFIVVDTFLILLQATGIFVPDPLLQAPDCAWKFDR